MLSSIFDIALTVRVENSVSFASRAGTSLGFFSLHFVLLLVSMSFGGTDDHLFQCAMNLRSTTLTFQNPPFTPLSSNSRINPQWDAKLVCEWWRRRWVLSLRFSSSTCLSYFLWLTNSVAILPSLLESLREHAHAMYIPTMNWPRSRVFWFIKR